MMEVVQHSPEEMAEQVRLLAEQLKMAGRKDLLLRAIGAPLLEELRIEAARTKLSRLQITKDYRFFLVDYDNKEVELQPTDEILHGNGKTAGQGENHGRCRPLGESAGQCHQREVFAHQEGIPRPNG